MSQGGYPFLVVEKSGEVWHVVEKRVLDTRTSRLAAEAALLELSEREGDEPVARRRFRPSENPG